MSTRVVGKTNERRRDRRRELVIESTLDDQPIHIVDIGLSGFGARTETRDRTWPMEGQRSELRFTDYKGRETLILVEITNVFVAEGRFGGKFYELPGDAFDVIQDLVMLRDLRHTAAAG